MNNLSLITQKELELIDAYLSGRLPQAEKIAFEQRLQNEPEWAERVKEIKLIALGIQQNALRNTLVEISNTSSPGKPAIIRKINWFRRIAAAAILVIFVSALSWVLFFRTPANEKIFAAYYQPDDGLPTEMGVSNNYPFEHAMVDYKRGNYTQAADAWKTLLKKVPGNDTLQYFIASAEMADYHLQQALDGFNVVLQHPHSTFEQDAWWYKGLLLLKQNKKGEAYECVLRSAHPQKAALLQKLKE